MKRAGVLVALCIAFTIGAQQRNPSEMVQNGDFESGMTGWSYVERGHAKGSVELVTDNPLNEKSPHSLKLDVTELGRSNDDLCGVANAGFSGMNIVSGQWYEVTFCARRDGGGGLGLVFSLETDDGKKVCSRTTLPEIGRGGIGTAIEGNNQWSRYAVTLHAYASDPKCRLVISPVEPGAVYLDEISLHLRSSPEK